MHVWVSMYKITIGFLLLLPMGNPVWATAPTGDTLSTGYLNAVYHWLYGRNDLARNALRQIAFGSPSVERDASRNLLLDEFYFWPGHYQQYLQLADTMKLRNTNYGLVSILANQPAFHVHFSHDSLQIPFVLKHKAHVVVNVRINGRHVRLVVDSGAQRTMLSRQIANQIGIKRLSSVHVINYEGQSILSSIGMADSVNLSGLSMYNLPIIISSLPIPGIDGLLGWDVLRQFAILIDYTKRQLILSKSVPDSKLEANLLGGSRPMLLLRTPSGNPLFFNLDTGSDEDLRVSPTGLTRVGTYQLGRKLSIRTSVGRLMQIGLEKQVRTLTIGLDNKLRQYRRTVLFKSDEIIWSFIRDGLIGGRSFRKGKLLLDAPNHHFSYTE